MNHVRQEEPFGCGIACVAMVAGTTYAEVRALLGDWWTGRTRGMTHYVVFELLSHLGFACINSWHTNQLNYRPREPWPPEPLADVHIVMVNVSGGSHFVVWLRDGTVWDPDRAGPQSLSDYPPPSQVIGIIPIRNGA